MPPSEITASQASSGQTGHPAANPELDDARLRAELTAAGLDEGDVEAAIAVLRKEFEEAVGRKPAVETERFRTLADITPQLIWHANGEGYWVWVSPSWIAYTGQSESESRGIGWLNAIHPDDRERTIQAWREASGRGSLDIEHRIRRGLDGAWRMHQTRSALLPCEAEQAEGLSSGLEWIGASTDIEDFRRLESEQHALLLELRHRTRNLLAVVQAIAHRSLAPASRSDFTARLASLGRVQGFLSRNAAWSVPLRDLVEAEIRALADGGADRVSVIGPEVDLPGEVVQPVALALHELASNAAKHGAMAQPSGQLAVRWRLENDDGIVRLIIEWRESGVSMSPGPLPRRFGCQVIERTVPHQLRGEVSLQPSVNGIRCRLALPLSSAGGPEGNRWTGSSRAGIASPLGIGPTE